MNTHAHAHVCRRVHGHAHDACTLPAHGTQEYANVTYLHRSLSSAGWAEHIRRDILDGDVALGLADDVVLARLLCNMYGTVP